MRSGAEELFCQCRSINGEVRGDISEHSLQRPDPQTRMTRNCDMMFAAQLRREAHVTAGLTRYRVASAAQSARQVMSGKVARRPYHSRCDHFVAYVMQPNHLWPLTILVVASDGVSHRLAKLCQIVRLGEDRCSDCARDVAPRGGFLDDEQDLGHARLLWDVET